MSIRVGIFAALSMGALLFGAVAHSASPRARAWTGEPIVESALGGTAEFVEPGMHTWTAPPGVTGVLVELWGGGGGGSRPYGYQAAGDGGGSGAYVRTVVTVVPGETYLLVVGRPGLGATPPAAFGTPGSFGGRTTFAHVTSGVLAWAGGGYGGNDAHDGQGGLADATAPIRREGRAGSHGFGITPGAGGKAWLGSLEPPAPLGGGMGGVGQIDASGQNGSPGYAILLW